MIYAAIGPLVMMAIFFFFISFFEKDFLFSCCMFAMVTCAIAASVLGFCYSSANPENFSAQEKLKYYEQGKELPTERNPKYEEAYKSGWENCWIAPLISLIGYGIYFAIANNTRNKRKERKLKRLYEEKDKLRDLITGDEQYDKIIYKNIEVIDKTAKSIEWQYKLHDMKNSLKTIEDIRRDPSWKDLQESIDELEAFIDLSMDELEN